MEEKSCCFTGHRKISSDKFEIIHNRLEREIVKLIKQGITYFYAGGALGFDTIAAQEVLKLKKIYPYIKLILVLPCKTQTYLWKKEDIEIYEDIKRKCNDIIYVSETYNQDCMFKRNQYLVDKSDICICYLIDNKSGTGYTVKYAKSQKLTIINIA